jgi:hypothetical protein
MSFRAAPGTVVAWIDTGVEKGFSNFLFVDQHYGSDPVMRRVLSLARQHSYQSLLIEGISEADCALFQEENTALRVRRSDYVGSIVHRLSFFKTSANQSPQLADFCGYVVHKTDRFTNWPYVRGHVFECVIAPVRNADQNNCIHCQRTFQVHTSAGVFTVRGVLYARQNDLTFVCAHVGLRTVLSVILPEGDITYSRLNAICGVDHKGVKVGEGNGLSPDQCEQVFASLGLEFSKVAHEPATSSAPPAEFHRYLYGIIESGNPALMGFELNHPGSSLYSGVRHLIPVFGHTFNEDTWLHYAKAKYFGGNQGYFPSENWLSTFVVHDDNFGPYYCLPRSVPKSDNFRLLYGLVAKPTPMNAFEAEAVAYSYVSGIVNRFGPRGEDWYDRFTVFAQNSWLVLRTFLVEKADYITHLANLRDWGGIEFEPERVSDFNNRMPERFWVIEASAPELFASSRRKFGDILIRADSALPAPLDNSLFLAARLPGLCIFSGSPDLEVARSRLKGHSALFSMPLRGQVVV